MNTTVDVNKSNILYVMYQLHGAPEVIEQYFWESEWTDFFNANSERFSFCVVNVN